jgi:DNA-binding transcriptional LysR family regulator
MISLKQLSYALALRDFGNFHRAAQSVNISQPAFSRSISSLEDALGATLFNRRTGHITPTIYGEALLARAELVLAETGEMLREIQLLRGRESGSLTLAAGVYAAEMSANRTVGEMVRRYPNLQYNSQLASWHEIAGLVKSRAVDIGVAEISTLAMETHLEMEPVGRHDVIFFVRRTHPLLGKKRLTRGDLSGYPVATVRSPPRVAGRMPGRGHLDPETGEFIPAAQVNDLATARTVVSNSDAIGVAAPLQIETWLRTGDLVFLPYRPNWLKLDYGVVYLKNRMLSPAMETFIELFRRIDAEHGKLNRALMLELTEQSFPTAD